MRYVPMIAGCLLAAAAHPGAAPAEGRPVLTVYTYDSFTAEWGPGPGVKAAFEATCGCELSYVTAGDGAALLSRVLLEGADTRADVVLGLDQNLIQRAADSGIFADQAIGKVAYDLPVPWDDPIFVPYDWGYFAFVYDKTKTVSVPASFEELAASKLKIVIEDPRSSTPGLGLLLWVEAAYGDKAADIWKGLADNIVTVTPGWSEAYGLFLQGEADMVLSYTTSPAYHLIAEKDGTKAAARFSEGHFLEVEVAAKVASSRQPALADKFLAFMVSDSFQSLIPETNWMYPAVMPKAGLPAGFGTLIVPGKALIYAPPEAQSKRKEALTEWLTALGH